jgi:Fur family transcriptional regulator, ferric uptake regulator
MALKKKLLKEGPISRNTKQREIILQILKSKGTPLSAVEILKSAQKKLPELNKTTVYRTLERLAGEQVVSAVQLKSGIVHYEVAHESHHHHHFVCNACSGIFCLKGCPAELKALLPAGFLMTDHEVTLKGLCSKCR